MEGWSFGFCIDPLDAREDRGGRAGGLGRRVDFDLVGVLSIRDVDVLPDSLFVSVRFVLDFVVLEYVTGDCRKTNLI